MGESATINIGTFQRSIMPHTEEDTYFKFDTIHQFEPGKCIGSCENTSGYRSNEGECIVFSFAATGMG